MLVHLKATKFHYFQIQEYFLAHSKDESQYILGQLLWVQHFYYRLLSQQHCVSISKQRRFNCSEVMRFAKLQSCKQSWD